jgi:hypothetical protein
MGFYKLILLLPFVATLQSMEAVKNGVEDIKVLLWGHDVVTKARALGIPMPSDPYDRGLLSSKEVIKRDFSPDVLARQKREFAAAEILENAGKYDEAFRAYMHLAAEWNLEANWRMSDIEFHGGMDLHKREGFYLFSHRWRVVNSELKLRESLSHILETTGSYGACTWMAVARGIIPPTTAAAAVVEEPRRLSTESAASAVAMSDGASRRSSGDGSDVSETLVTEAIDVDLGSDTAPLLGAAATAAAATYEGLRHRKVPGKDPT